MATKKQIRRLVAHYLSTEGCSCCEGDNHRKHGDEMCAALDFPRYDDDSGWDWSAVLEAPDEND